MAAGSFFWGMGLLRSAIPSMARLFLEWGCAVAWRRLAEVCTFRTLSLFRIVLAPLAVFPGARRAPDAARYCLVGAVYTNARFLAFLTTPALSFSLPFG